VRFGPLLLYNQKQISWPLETHAKGGLKLPKIPPYCITLQLGDDPYSWIDHISASSKASIQRRLNPMAPVTCELKGRKPSINLPSLKCVPGNFRALFKFAGQKCQNQNTRASHLHLVTKHLGIVYKDLIVRLFQAPEGKNAMEQAKSNEKQQRKRSTAWWRAYI
jgi:hypothetical protein